MSKSTRMPIIWVVLTLLCATRALAQDISGYCGRQTAYNVDSTNLQWNFETSTGILTISGHGQMKDYDMDTKAPWWYTWRNDIQQVVIGDGVTTIGTYAMWDLPSVDSVHFGNSVEQIRYNAFERCISLQHLYFPNSLQMIEQYAFNNNQNLVLVDFGESEAIIEYYAFAWLQALQTVRCAKVRELRWRCYDGCSLLTNLNLGDSLRLIEEHAFSGCYSLRKVYIPASVQSIGGGAFAYTSSLDSIIVDTNNTYYHSNGNCNAIIRYDNNSLVAGCRNSVIPNGTQRIEDYAFEGCVGLQTITLPEGILEVGTEAFSNCSSLQSVNFPNSITNAGCRIFWNCVSLQTPVYNNRFFAFLPLHYKGAYTMPAHIQEMCCGACCNCDSLTTITLSEHLHIIPGNAFEDCRQLTSIIIPDSVTTLQYSAFSGCSALESVAIPADLQEIQEYVFNGCNSLKHIVWNAKDARLSWIFYDSSQSESNIRDQMYWYHPFYNIRQQIQSVTFGDSVRVIPRYLCYEMENLTSLSLGYEVDSIERYAFEGCKRISTIHWNARTCTDPVLYTATPFYSFRSTIHSFTFGDSVQHIPAYLCHGMSNLRHLHIPKNVSSIGTYAFRYLNALDSISVDENNTSFDSRNGCNALIETGSDRLLLGCYKTHIPEDILGIESCAFLKVRGLKEAIIPEGVSYIGTEAFNGCADMDTLALPSKLKVINDYAFQDCSRLDTLILPDSLTYIGIRAFANCSGLSVVNLPESVESLDQYIFSGCTNLDYIMCHAPLPPVIQTTTFGGTSCPLFVPCPSIADYREAPVWQDIDSLRVSGWFDFELVTRSNNDAYGMDTIFQFPDCETEAIIYAEPYAGYEFIGWTDSLGNILSTDPLYEFFVEDNMTVTAVFKLISEDLNALNSYTSIRVNAQDVIVRTNVDTHAALYDMTGRKVDAGAVAADVETALHAPATGVYVAVVNGQQQKVIIK